MKKVWASVAVAAVLWFLMFSPWTAPHLNFWYAMTGSAILLTTLACIFCKEWVKDFHVDLQGIGIGILVAAILWGVFWVGDKVSQWMFSFARPEVNMIYDMKDGNSPVLIALLLFFIIGPAEEIFWRIFVQRRMSEKWGANAGWIVATLAYTLIHIWSFNFMLIMAALVCGFLWGLFYRLWPKKIFPLILSHALWDAFAFVILPF